MTRTHDDPTSASPWPIWLKCFWAFFGGAICFLWSLALLVRISPRSGRLHDFVQEWTSAKNFLLGEPIYTDLRVTIPRYLGLPYDDIVTVNAHPPTSVLVSIPFAELSYPLAFTAWSVVSLIALVAALWLIKRPAGLNFTAWMLLPVSAFVLTSDAFAQQVNQGQFNLILLLLLTAAWAADRGERWGLSGGLLAIAAAIKIFPAFLLLYFVARRRWQAVNGFVITFVASTSLTCVVLGWESYRDYVTIALPQVGQFRDYWVNASITGFFTRLFDPTSGHVIPIYAHPLLAKFSSLAACGLVVASTTWVVWRVDDKDVKQSDQAFSLCVIAMLLVSPITWNHYFMLLLLPLATFWKYAESWRWRGVIATLGVLLITLDPRWLWSATIPGGGELALVDASVASPLAAVTVLAYPFYALAGLYAFAVLTTSKAANRERATAPTQPKTALTAAMVKA